MTTANRGDAAAPVEVCWVRLDQLPWTDDELEACLAPDELARAGRYRFERDRRRFVRRRAGLRFVLSRHLDTEPARLELTSGANGRPELTHAHGRDLRFNQSSSGDVAVFR